MASNIGDLDLAEPDLSQIDWSVYSEYYDELCKANPAYQELLWDFSERLGYWNLPSAPEICDFGAGTGSFVLAAGKKIPDAKFHHVDFDRGMLARAHAKYRDSGLDVAIHELDIRDFASDSLKFDLSVCVNTLYSIPNHEEVLAMMRRQTKPGGMLYIVDFGRKVEVLEWAVYILRNRVKDLGLRETIRWYRQNSENLSQNRRGAKAQSEGTYWLHTPEEFEAALSMAGWEVLEIDKCYRDCCDRAVCINPP